MSEGVVALEARIQALERDVAALRATEAIRELRRSYHARINEGRYQDLVELFSPDAFVRFGPFGEARGEAALRTLFGEQLFGEAVSFIKQFVHNHSVELAGDHARGYCYLEAKTVNQGESFFVAARYDDEYRRTPDGWRFTRMELRPAFTVPMGQGWQE